MSISQAFMFFVIFAGLVVCVAYFRVNLRSRKGERNSGGDSVA